MDGTCYWCGHSLAGIHYVTFYEPDGGERNEPLCDECYAEWLESLKG
ncbi:hypothetical protein JCM14720_00560 [Calditerricola yamamurae]